MLTRFAITVIAWAVLTVSLVAGIWPLSWWPLSMVMVAIGVFSWSWDEVVEVEQAAPVPRRQRSAMEMVALTVLIEDLFGSGGDDG